MNLEQTATERQELHKDHASSRPLSPDYELVGLAGEKAAADFFGLSPDLTARPGGDGGRDLTVTLRFTLDVKTARLPKWLLVEQGKVRADLYILAEYNDQTKTARLLGWAGSKDVNNAPLDDIGGRGIMSHYIPRSELRPMSELKQRLVRPAADAVPEV